MAFITGVMRRVTSAEGPKTKLLRTVMGMLIWELDSLQGKAYHGRDRFTGAHHGPHYKRDGGRDEC